MTNLTPERLNELADLTAAHAAIKGAWMPDTAQAFQEISDVLREYARIKPMWDALQPGPIEDDGHPFNPKQYIPFVGKWEVQTKGNGSTFRISDGKNQYPLFGLPAESQKYLEDMALNIRQLFNQESEDK